jgi:hypothetical protein
MSIYENYFCRSHDKERNLITKSQNVIMRIIENKNKIKNPTIFYLKKLGRYILNLV